MAGSAEPSTQRPYAIVLPGRRRRCALMPAPVPIPRPQRPGPPAGVVAVRGRVGHRLMDAPVLAEPVRLPRPPPVTTPVGRVLPFRGRGVHPAARRRLARRVSRRLRGAEGLPLIHGDDAAVL